MDGLKIYDITLPLQESLAAWPGDAPYRLERTLRIRDGATVNLSAMTMSVHNGTHTDAPYHFRESGATAEALDLSAYIGPAVVLDARGRNPIPVEAFAGVDFSATPRLLLRTDAWADPTRFPDAIPVLAEAVPDYLGARGVLLLGLDLPSVDALESKTLPNHHRLEANRIAILENLWLREVPPGRYELLALPLKLVGADAAPLRAVLIERPFP
jgi:arylformamidase